MIKKLHLVILSAILFTMVLSLLSYSYIYTNKLGGKKLLTKVSNSFGTPLNRDIDGDGDNDSAAIFHNIAGGNSSEYGEYLYVDSNGKIYITGYSSNGSNWDMYVIRLNSNGSVDNTFGSPLSRDINGDGTNDNAVVVNNIAGGNKGDYGNSLYVDSNGKVYVTGLSNDGNYDDIYVIKLNNDGSFDNSFGHNGKAVFPNITIGSNRSGRLLHVDSNGKIYLTGVSEGVIKLNNDGSFDNSFNDIGRVSFKLIAGGSSREEVNCLYVDKNGKIYITGESYSGKTYNIYVIRLNNNGRVDNYFGFPLERDINSDGVKDSAVVIDNIFTKNSDDVAHNIFVDSNGKVYVTGYSFKHRGYLNFWDIVERGAVYVIRLNSNGSLDNSFGNKGKIIINNIAGKNGADVGKCLYVDSNGKVYVTGYSYNGKDYDMYVLKIE